jgi:hypothetical protein
MNRPPLSAWGVRTGKPLKHDCPRELEFYGPLLGVEGLLKKRAIRRPGRYRVCGAAPARRYQPDKQAGIIFTGRCVNEDGVVEEGSVAVVAEAPSWPVKPPPDCVSIRKGICCPVWFSADVRCGPVGHSCISDGNGPMYPWIRRAAVRWFGRQRRTLWQHIKAGAW